MKLSSRFFAIATAAVFLFPLALTHAQEAKTPCQIVYVPTEQAVVEKMIEMAKVTKDDIVFDLGCGDGRIVCTAAKKFGCKGVGIDIDPARIRDCKETMRKFGVTDELVEIRQGDALKVKDLEKATVLLLYMLPEFMEKLEPQIKTRLKPGTRIVAHDFPFSMPPDQKIQFDIPGSRPKSLFLWTIREAKK